MKMKSQQNMRDVLYETGGVGDDEYLAYSVNDERKRGGGLLVWKRHFMFTRDACVSPGRGAFSERRVCGQWYGTSS